MLDRIAHRGPDGRGVWTEAGIALGHLRLSIIDLTDAAAQPMLSADRRWVVSYNGEIFNFRDLARPLRGPRRSTGDTEVLVESIAQLGLQATLARLEGDFAFAAWDRQERALHLVRDHHGVKPLYYANGPEGSVRFGSEIKAIADARAEPDPVAAQAALLGYSCTWGTRTMFKGVQSVMPGEQLELRTSSTPTSHRYFEVTEWVSGARHRELARLPEREVVQQVDAAFRTSMGGRMISDAPLATLVSGGVDSSLVAAVAAEASPDMTGYHADVRSDSEREPATQLAQALGIDLRITEVTDQDFLDAVPAVTWANEIPLIYHLNSVPFFLVSELARKDGIKVLLTGEGSDEYFLGYPQLALEPALERVSSARAAVSGALHHTVPRLSRLLWPREADRFSTLLGELVTGFESELVDAVSDAALDGIEGRRERRSLRLTLGLVQEHLVSLLHRNDRLGMAWSLEARFPFLGHDLARLALNLPATYKLRGSPRLHDRRHPFTIDKWSIRQVAAGVVPLELAERAKQGFPVSVDRRICATAEAFAGGWTADAFSLQDRSIRKLVEDGPSVWLTRLLLLDVWARLFVMGWSIEECQDHLRATTSLRP
jgi:asparagine synthase (glutamine-hydrolysing)